MHNALYYASAIDFLPLPLIDERQLIKKKIKTISAQLSTVYIRSRTQGDAKIVHRFHDDEGEV